MTNVKQICCEFLEEEEPAFAELLLAFAFELEEGCEDFRLATR